MPGQYVSQLLQHLVHTVYRGCSPLQRLFEALPPVPEPGHLVLARGDQPVPGAGPGEAGHRPRVPHQPPPSRHQGLRVNRVPAPGRDLGRGQQLHGVPRPGHRHGPAEAGAEADQRPRALVPQPEAGGQLARGRGRGLGGGGQLQDARAAAGPRQGRGLCAEDNYNLNQEAYKGEIQCPVLPNQICFLTNHIKFHVADLQLLLLSSNQK